MLKYSNYHQIKDAVREKAIACGRKIDDITLITVSKTQSIEAIQETYIQGCRDFGESRLQEALEKINRFPSDCKWHFIGSLQKNKVQKVISSFQLIHSVDTLELAEKIEELSKSKKQNTSILLQVNVSGERTKHGLSSEDWEKVLDRLNSLSHLKIEGLMTMAPLTNDTELIRSCFRQLYALRDRWRVRMREPNLFHHLSMGMSHDYLIAIEEGATLLRVGSAIFSNYTKRNN